MMEKLKPCPFCGGPVEKAEVYEDQENDIIHIVFRCENAGCYASTAFTFDGLAEIRRLFPGVSDEYINEIVVNRRAARYWNRRCSNE